MENRQTVRYKTTNKMSLVRVDGRLTGERFCQEVLAVDMLLICNYANKLMLDNLGVQQRRLY